MGLRLQFAQGVTNGRITKAHAELAVDSRGFHASRFCKKPHHHGMEYALCRQRFHFLARDAWRPGKADRVSDCIEVIRHFHLGLIDRIGNAARPTAKQCDESDSCKVIGMNVIREDIVFLSKGWLLCTESRGGQALMAIVDTRNPQHVGAERPKGLLRIKPTQ